MIYNLLHNKTYIIRHKRHSVLVYVTHTHGMKIVQHKKYFKQKKRILRNYTNTGSKNLAYMLITWSDRLMNHKAKINKNKKINTDALSSRQYSYSILFE